MENKMYELNLCKNRLKKIRKKLVKEYGEEGTRISVSNKEVLKRASTKGQCHTIYFETLKDVFQNATLTHKISDGTRESFKIIHHPDLAISITHLLKGNDNYESLKNLINLAFDKKYKNDFKSEIKGLEYIEEIIKNIEITNGNDGCLTNKIGDIFEKKYIWIKK